MRVPGIRVSVCDDNWVKAQSVRTVADLTDYLSRYSQYTGSPKICCDELGGVEYREISIVSTCRKDDAEAIDVASAECLKVLLQKIEDARWEFAPSEGLTIGDLNRMEIFWRVKPELGVMPFARVADYCDDGPDVDPMSDRRCVLDHRWVWVKVYARLAWGIPKSKVASAA